MDSEIRISGKDLGALALPTFCPRCFWIQRRLSGRLPFQVFPGIFSSIDAYTKKVVHTWFDDMNASPPWLGAMGPITGYVDPPSLSKFQFLDTGSGVRLTGIVDGILTRHNGERIIVDYKTARFTKGQDALLPVYRTQLNAYAVIAEHCDISPVTALALIYFEPATEVSDARLTEHRKSTGFAMQFDAHVEEIPLEPKTIAPLLHRVREILDQSAAPPRRDGCGDCEKVDGLVAAFSTSPLT